MVFVLFISFQTTNHVSSKHTNGAYVWQLWGESVFAICSIVNLVRKQNIGLAKCALLPLGWLMRSTNLRNHSITDVLAEWDVLPALPCLSWGYWTLTVWEGSKTSTTPWRQFQHQLAWPHVHPTVVLPLLFLLSFQSDLRHCCCLVFRWGAIYCFWIKAAQIHEQQKRWFPIPSNTSSNCPSRDQVVAERFFLL